MFELIDNCSKLTLRLQSERNTLSSLFIIPGLCNGVLKICKHIIYFLLATIIISLDIFFFMCHEKEKVKRKTKGNVEMILIIVLVSRSGTEPHWK